MRFCLWLTETGHLGAEEAVRVLRTISRRTPPLGRVAVRLRVLTVRQVAELLAAEVDGGNSMIGKAALERGWIGSNELLRLLDAQRAQSPSARDVLMELGLMTRDQVDTAWRAFTRAM